MILSLAVILGLLVCVVRHRSETANRIAAISLRSPWLALLALALQVPLLWAPYGPRQEVTAAQVAFLFSHLLLLIFVWLNRRVLGIGIVGIGVLSNLFVILINGGLMPITPQTLARINPGSTPDQWTLGFHYGRSKDIILLQRDTALWALSDILVLPPPFPWPTAFSLGDLLIAAGIIVTLQGPISLERLAHRFRSMQKQSSQHAHSMLHEEEQNDESQES